MLLSRDLRHYHVQFEKNKYWKIDASVNLSGKQTCYPIHCTPLELGLDSQIADTTENKIQKSFVMRMQVHIFSKGIKQYLLVNYNLTRGWEFSGEYPSLYKSRCMHYF